tara:strand:+ start:7343 stop:8056 length:714 start_codon:yes stop_codon:yes gene_type:complete
MTEETPLDDVLDTTHEQEEPATEPEQTAEPEEPVKEPAEETPGEPDKAEQPMVPLKALHEVRDKTRALEQELAAMKTPPKEQEQAKAPDVFADPEGYNAHWEKRLNDVQQSGQEQMRNERLNTSERYATKEHGTETIEAVKAWVQERNVIAPGFGAQVLGQSDPYEYAVQQYKREQLTDQLTSDPGKLTRVLELLEAQQEPLAPAPLAPTTTAGSRSVNRKAVAYDVPTSLDDILGG